MPLPLSPLRFLERARDVYANKLGVICHEKQFTYGQFAARCGQLASALTSIGVRPGDRVAYLSFNTHQLLEGYYGVVQAGAIVTPLNVRLTAPELVGILKHAEPAALLFEAEFAPTVEMIRKECPAIRLYIGLDPESPGADLNCEAALSAQSPAEIDYCQIHDEDTAELFYTSGSTGSPKGVMLSHRALYQHTFAIASVYDDPNTAVDLHTIPLFHANGWGRPQVDPMLGVTQIMVRRFDPAAVLGTIGKFGATGMSLVPTMANALLNVPSAHSYNITPMQTIMLGGAAASPALIERLEKLFPCANVFAGYGLTETSPVLTTARDKGPRQSNDAERWRRRAMTGYPIPGATVRVVDDQMRDVARDSESVGEIVASCDWLMSGYFRDPEGTAAVMTGPNGEPGGVAGRPVWFHTGDMAVWDDERFILIVDRKKEIIISGGENISSQEIEKHIFAFPGVLECAVVAAPDPQWGEIPVAIVVRKPGEQFTAEELIHWLEQRLSRFKLPRRVEFSGEPLPKTGTGKILKMVLREPFWASHEKRVQG
jgi:fatty-acyl-CoA synthase